MISEQLITFKTAQLAKQAGFDIPVPHYFTPNGVSIAHTKEGYDQEYYCYDVDDFVENWNYKGLSVTADDNISYGGNYMIPFSQPTQSLLQRWLREVHNSHAEVTSRKDNDKIVYTWDIYDTKISDEETTDEEPLFDTYELALEQALQEALTLIINRKDDNLS